MWFCTCVCMWECVQGSVFMRVYVWVEKKTISVPEDIAKSQFSFPLVAFVIHIAIMNYEKFEISYTKDKLHWTLNNIKLLAMQSVGWSLPGIVWNLNSFSTWTKPWKMILSLGLKLLRRIFSNSVSDWLVIYLRAPSNRNEFEIPKRNVSMKTLNKIQK